MSFTAAIPQDTVNLYGRNGVETADDSVDTIYIDLDLAASSGLVITGNKLAANVDGSTIVINGSNQLQARHGVDVLNDLSNVTITSPTSEQTIIYSGGTWINVDMGLIGDPGVLQGPAQTVVISASTSATALVSPTSHAHSTSGVPVATSSHTHTVGEFTSGGPSPTGTAALGLSPTASNTTAAYAAFSANTQNIASMTHTHTRGTLKTTP